MTFEKMEGSRREATEACDFDGSPMVNCQSDQEDKTPI